VALQHGAGNAAVARLLGQSRLQRDSHAPAPALTGVKLDHNRVSIPAPSGATVHARPVPASAAPKWTLEPGRAPVDPSTTIDEHGVVTVGAGQKPGDIKIAGTVVSTDPAGGTTTTTANQTLFLPPAPSGVASTRVSGGLSSVYGGIFEHTLTAPSGQAADLEGAHVNELFAGVPNPNAATHAIGGTPFGTFTLESNDPTSPKAGWDIDSSATLRPDNVGIGKGMVRASKFVRSASNPSPDPLSGAHFTVVQSLRALEQGGPVPKYMATAFATVDHIRGLRASAGSLEVFVSVNGVTEAQDYVGPPAFTNARANPVTVMANQPAPAKAGGKPPSPPPAPTTVQISVDTVPAYPASGHDARFSIVGNHLGCKIDPVSGVLTIGTEPGTVTVRARDVVASNPAYDEIAVVITPHP
jgi:hypothetical protein